MSGLNVNPRSDSCTIEWEAISHNVHVQRSNRVTEIHTHYISFVKTNCNKRTTNFYLPNNITNTIVLLHRNGTCAPYAIGFTTSYIKSYE